jgi:hypothetical protein
VVGAVGCAAGLPGGSAGARATARLTAAAPAPAKARLRHFVCERALDPPARAISVTAVMRPVTGTRSLQMSFALLERASGSSSWTPVSGPHFGVWISPVGSPTLGRRPGDVWTVPFPVANLAAPATYRLQVAFRWLGRRGIVLATTTRLTQSCRQSELRPDLTVASVDVRQNLTRPGYDVFSTKVRNVGATAAAGFMVQLSYRHNQQSVTSTKVLVRLKGHSAATVVFGGPRCDLGTSVAVTADPGHVVDVYSRSAASLAVSCPATQVAGTP